MKIDVTRFVNFCLKPHGIVLATVLMSYAAWQFPGFGIFRKGFEERESLLSTGALLVAVWYALILASAAAGFRFGRSIRTRTQTADQLLGLDTLPAYLVLTLIGSVGFAYLLLFLLQHIGLSGIKTFILEGQGNQLKETLYEDYAVGPLSLRYTVILSGGVAIYRMLSGVSRSWLELFNLGQLLLTGLVSSRLSLIIALFIGVGLFVASEQPIRVNLAKVGMLGGAVFLVLAIYNASRNMNYYQARGNEGFLDAGFSEMLAYTGAPFQGALATGVNFPAISAGREVASYSGIDESLTTNSAFAELTEDIGSWSFPVAIAGCFCAAALMGALTAHFHNYFALSYFVLLYSFSELWRIFMFHRGIVLVLLAFSFGAPYALLSMPRKSTRRVRRGFIRGNG